MFNELGINLPGMSIVESPILYIKLVRGGWPEYVKITGAKNKNIIFGYDKEENFLFIADRERVEYWRTYRLENWEEFFAEAEEEGGGLIYTPKRGYTVLRFQTDKFKMSILNVLSPALISDNGIYWGVKEDEGLWILEEIARIMRQRESGEIKAGGSERVKGLKEENFYRDYYSELKREGDEVEVLREDFSIECWLRETCTPPERCFNRSTEEIIRGGCRGYDAGVLKVCRDGIVIVNGRRNEWEAFDYEWLELTYTDRRIREPRGRESAELFIRALRMFSQNASNIAFHIFFRWFVTTEQRERSYRHIVSNNVYGRRGENLGSWASQIIGELPG